MAFRTRLLSTGSATTSGYASLLAFANRVRDDVGDLKPRHMTDIQPFFRVQGSDEYEE